MTSFRPNEIMEPLHNEDVANTDNQIITNHVDLISQLPDDVLTHILSFLPTIDTVHTFILSKEWVDKWRNNFQVEISDSPLFALSCNRLDKVVEFVSRIILLIPTITKFSLVLSNRYNPEQIKTWISEIVPKNVVSIHIIHDGEAVDLPHCLFYCQTLNKLKLLMSCIFLVPDSGWFWNLHTLYLHGAQISSELHPNSCQHLQLHFPVLKKLLLVDCMWLNVGSVEIKAGALIKFQVWQFLKPPDTIYCPIKVSVAELQLYGFMGYCLWDVDLHTSSVSCVDVFLDFPGTSLEDLNRNASFTQRILKRCWFMKSLKLDGELLKVILKSGQRHLLHELTMLKQLKLYSSCDSKSLFEFLSLTPSLEHICLNVDDWRTFDYHSLESLPSCVVSQLVEVVFIRFEGTFAQLSLASFFLKKGLALRKMLGLVRSKYEGREEEHCFWNQLKWRLTVGDHFDAGDALNE